MALSARPADRHRQIARGFTDHVRGAKSWDVPSPVAAWTARDVVRHLVEWLPPFLRAGSGVELPCRPSVDDGPVRALAAPSDAAEALLDDPATGDRRLPNPHSCGPPAGRAVAH